MKRKRTEEIPSQGENHERERFYRKNAEFFQLIDKIRLWPARGGILHGIRSMEFHGTTARITTFCGESFVVRNSRNSRAARWLRNKWCGCKCRACGIPDWKIAKYSKTHMNQSWGSDLADRGK